LKELPNKKVLKLEIDFSDRLLFPSLRRIHVIVDGSEFPIWKPRLLEDRRKYYSGKSKDFMVKYEGTPPNRPMPRVFHMSL
jgi:hypothetical protein